MGDKKVDILAEYNERESQVVKWSAYSRNELSEEFRAEIEAELITKRAAYESGTFCPACGLHSERIGACNQMACRCGCKYCYICGSLLQTAPREDILRDAGQGFRPALKATDNARSQNMMQYSFHWFGLRPKHGHVQRETSPRLSQRMPLTFGTPRSDNFRGTWR